MEDRESIETAQIILNDIIELIEKTDSLVDSLKLETFLENEPYDSDSAEIDSHFQQIWPAFDEYDELTTSNFIFNSRCDACKIRESLFWRRVGRRLIVCNSCFFKKTYLILFSDENIKRNESSSNQSNDSKKKKLKSNRGKIDSASNRPLTRTALNGKSTKNGHNNSSTIVSSNSVTPATKSESQPVAANSRPETPNLDDETKDLCSIENKLSKNVRKSARISQSKTKLKSRELTAGEELDAQEESTTDSKSNTETHTNRRTKTFKNKRPNQLRYESKVPVVQKIYTYDCAFHRGFYFKIGDIVCLRRQISSYDTENYSDDQLNIYFAQIRAFFSDQYGEKSAVLTWLIPIGAPHRSIQDFDLRYYTLGPAEEFSRSLDTLEFVCRPDNLALADLANRNSDCGASYYYDYRNQYKSDLLRHRFELEDLAASNFRIVTTKTDLNGLKHEFFSN